MNKTFSSTMRAAAIMRYIHQVTERTSIRPCDVLPRGPALSKRRERCESVKKLTSGGRRVRSAPSGSLLARGRPDVDLAVGRVPIDLGELVVGERELLERRDVLLELPDTRRSDERRRHASVTEHPSKRHLRERLTATGCDVIQRTDLLQRVIGHEL